MALSSLSDAELWTLIASDNYRAFKELFSRYWKTLYKTAHNYISQEEKCEEVVHDVFLNIWNRRKYLHINDFNHYLKAATRYQVYACLKKIKFQPIEFCENVYESNEFDTNNGYENILYSELQEEIYEHLKPLPKRCREIFILSRINHLSNSEISERLLITKDCVENQICIASKHLRRNLKQITTIIIFLILTIF